MNTRLNQQTLDNLRHQLLQIVPLGVRIAERSISTVQKLFLISLVSAAWLTFLFVQQFSLSFLVASVLVLILGIPAWLLARLYFALREVIRLPERIANFFDSMKITAGEFQQVKVGVQEKFQAGRFTLAEILSLGKVIRQVKHLIGEFKELQSPIGGALILANPVFIVLIGTATMVALVLALVAVIAALIYLL